MKTATHDHKEHTSNNTLLKQPCPGRLEFGGARMALLDIEAGFWGVRRQLEALAGRRLTDTALQQAGANGGASFAHAFAPHVTPDTAVQALRDCVAAYQAAGFGQFTLEIVEWPIGRVRVRGTDTFEAWMVARHDQSPTRPVCAYTAGVLVGFINALTGRRDIVGVEHTCQAQGAEACIFDLLPAAAAEDATVVAFDPDPYLSQQLNLLETLFNRMPMGIAILDRDLTLRRCNPTWADFIERYTPSSASQAFPGTHLFDLAPGTEENFRPIYARVMGGETVRVEAFRSESGGIVSYWDAVFTPLYEDGDIVAMMDVVTDATERVQAEQELKQTVATLREREERLGLVLQGTNDGIWDWDVSTDQVFYSPRWKSMLGYAEDEISHTFAAWRQLVHPEDVAKVETAIEAHLAGETEQYQLEHRLRHKDGSYRWILARGKAVRDEDGIPIRMVGSHTDVTDRKLAEAALRRSEEHHRSLLENAANFVVYRIAVDAEAPYGGRVVMVSPSIKEIVGLDDPYDFGAWFENVRPGHYERIVAANERAMREGIPYNEVVQLYHPRKQRWVWLHTVSTPVLDEAGNPTYFNGMIVDITEQKEAEEALQYRMELENLITTISTNFINLAQDEVDAGIGRALQELGEFAGVDQAYVYLFEDGGSTLLNAYEWDRDGADGAGSQTQNSDRFPAGAFPWTVSKLRQNHPLHIPDVSALPPEAGAEKETFQTQGIQSVLAVPMRYQGKTIGFLGFDSRHTTKTWSEDTIALLKIVGEIFVNALQHRRAQQIQAGQRRFLELLATGRTLSETLHTLIRTIEAQAPGMLGLILTLDDEDRLHLGASVSLPRDYLDSIEGLEIGPMVGSCGTASYLAERVIVEDIAVDPRWDGLRSLAVEYGLRACWSEPVISAEGTVLGTFAMYYHEPRSPTRAELRLIETGAHLAGVAIERKQAEEALQESQRVLSTLMSNLPGMAYRCRNDAEWTMSFASEGSYELTGYPPEALIDSKEITYGALIHPDDRAMVWDEVQTAVHKKEPFQLRYRIRTADDQEKWVWEQGRGIYGPEGNLMALEGFATDFTERVMAEQVLEKHVAERTRELTTLLDVSHNLTSTLELEPLLGLILDQLREVVDYTGATILTVGGDELVVLAHQGPIPDEKIARIRFPFAEAASRDAILERKTIILPDVKLDTPLARAYQAGGGKDFQDVFGYVRSWMAVPLVVKDHVIGILSLDHSQPNFYSDQHANLALAFANQAAVAIENAQLYQNVHDAAAAEERNRLARELHDAVTQTLFSASLIADVLPRIWERNPDKGRQQLEALRELTRGALAEMRTLLLELRPATLTEESLDRLLRQLTEAIVGRARLRIELHIEGERALPPEVQVALYRVAQESLNNVIKHASASHVNVTLRYEPEEVTLIIADNGRGFDLNDLPPSSLGVGIMRERVEKIGAKLKIASQIGKGTRVTITWHKEKDHELASTDRKRDS